MDGHFELTGFNMKEKKDYDVSFNTTLSDVSELWKRISHLGRQVKGLLYALKTMKLSLN